ncbi:YibE/F family protein [Georgenia alba]|uniref:YibE/F family protein n=1 Tax=Georgenia alba TaxID=2233858 RepID=A0ABW2Q927_9MICO
MAHSHTHDEVTLPRREARRVRWVLTALVAPLLLATIAGLVALWPRGETEIGSIPVTGTGMSVETGTVVEVVDDGTGGSADPGAPQGGGAEQAGGQVRVELSTGRGAGQVVPVQVPPEIMANGMEAGDELRLLFSPQAMGTGSPYVFWDFERRAPVGWLALGYGLVVLAVARLRGLAAMAGLGASLAVITVFVIPAIMLGSSPVLVALVGSAAMLFFSLYLAHGISIRTTTALLGTFVGLAVTVLLATWGTRAANLTGSTSDASLFLNSHFPNLSLTDLLLCGIVIAGLGALNDVTITQASAVWELHAADPAASRRTLMGRGMRIGRDHIASTVYTLAFAYVGTALPVLMSAALMDRAVMDTLMAGEIAEEIVRTLVSSIGLVLAIPATTGIAVALVRTSAGRGRSERSHTGGGLPEGAGTATMAG